MMARLYDTVLDRLPNGLGLAAWKAALAGGMTPQQITDGFTGSAEFQGKYGALDDDVFIRQIYRNVLDHEGEASGVDAWKVGLAAGLARQKIVLRFFRVPRAPNQTDGSNRRWHIFDFKSVRHMWPNSSNSDVYPPFGPIIAMNAPLNRSKAPLF
jgi:hypothetical protein